MIAAEFVFRTMQLANLLAGAIAIAIGILLAYDAWVAERRYFPALLTLRTSRFAMLMVIIGAVPVFDFIRREADVGLLWMILTSDQAGRLSALGGLFAMFGGLGLATALGTGKPRRIAVMWLVLLAGAFAATAVQNVG